MQQSGRDYTAERLSDWNRWSRGALSSHINIPTIPPKLPHFTRQRNSARRREKGEKFNIERRLSYHRVCEGHLPLWSRVKGISSF